MGLEQDLLFQFAQIQFQLAVFLELDQEFINHERVCGDLLGPFVSHQLRILVSEGQQTTRLAADDRDTLLGVGVKLIHVGYGVGGGVVQEALRYHGTATALGV